jgi:BTB/POZ domain
MNMSSHQTDGNQMSSTQSFQPTAPVAMETSAAECEILKQQTANKDAVAMVTDGEEDSALSASTYTYEDKRLFCESFGQLNEFRKAEKFCDVDICVGTHHIKCHRLVLACFSQYFRCGVFFRYLLFVMIMNCYLVIQSKYQ